MAAEHNAMASRAGRVAALRIPGLHSARSTGTAGVQRPQGAPEVWGGIECSVVRIADTWRDQVKETGHHERGTGDIDRLAELGIRIVRYPVLWERNVRRASLRDTDWRWQDRQLDRLRWHGIDVIAGLVHHGSGPAWTNLLDPQFPEHLAKFAGAAAERYRWIDRWTIVNEPLTTARFSCLYGHWYPHLRDEAAFMRAVAIQCRATLLAMRAIRKYRPMSRFVQTEDVGKVFSTPPLAAQARYENERRWLSLDLLCGRVNRCHAWHPRMIESGVPERDLAELATGEAAPDVIGVNHYATSDRFLDHRIARYAPALRGGNGRQSYVDVEAVRVPFVDDATGWAPRLREVWDRYRRPIAVTEAHLGCGNIDESSRWLMEAWSAACALRADGVPVQAVTAWALFGLVDWDSMLREHRGRFEPGAFDTRFDPPRMTDVARAVSSLAREGGFTDDCLSEPGWWRRDDRYLAGLGS